MRLDVVTILPDYFAPLRLSLLGRAITAGTIDARIHDLRDFTHDRHRTVDDTPYGGGAGMVMKPEPWGECLDAILADAAVPILGGRPVGGNDQSDADQVGEVPRGGERPLLVVTAASGRPFTQRLAQFWSTRAHLVFACGRYEGIDARVADHARTRMDVCEVSIGDYVLFGGEAAALVMIEALARLIPGVIGNPASLDQESYSVGTDGLLEYPTYTKPASWRGLEVPEILLSGDHGRIAAWRAEQSRLVTAQRRPDLLVGREDHLSE